MNLKLKAFSPVDGRAEWELLQRIGSGENGFMNDGFEIDYDYFGDYLLKHIKMSNSIDLKSHLVPQSSYWLMEDDRPVGFGKVRHRLNGALLEKGGHIGYCINPDCRGKGYGKKLLAMLLERARLKGIDAVLITCDKTNPASQRVILANGGILHKEDDTDHWYWINL